MEGSDNALSLLDLLYSSSVTYIEERRRNTFVPPNLILLRLTINTFLPPDLVLMLMTTINFLPFRSTTSLCP